MFALIASMTMVSAYATEAESDANEIAVAEEVAVEEEVVVEEDSAAEEEQVVAIAEDDQEEE